MFGPCALSVRLQIDIAGWCEMSGGTMLIFVYPAVAAWRERCRCLSLHGMYCAKEVYLCEFFVFLSGNSGRFTSRVELIYVPDFFLNYSLPVRSECRNTGNVTF